MPTIGMIGAAITTVIAELVNCMMQMLFSKPFFDWRTLELKPIASCICGSAFIGIICLLCNGFCHSSLMKMVYIRFHEMGLERVTSEKDKETLKNGIEFLELRKRFFETGNIALWIKLASKYRDFYNSTRGCLGDLYFVYRK